MTPSTLRRLTAATTAVLLSLSAHSACSAPGGQLGTDRRTAESCPAAGINMQVGIDGTGSFRSAVLKESNLREIASAVRTVAICGGHLRVFGFASSSGQTVTVYEDDLSVDAPTDNARARKAGKLADDTTAHIAERYDDALNQLTGAGTDVIGMLALLADAKAQAPVAELYGVLLTDGLTNIGIDPTSAHSAEEASALAAQVAVPDLSGASIRMVGVGRQADSELSSTTIEILKAFWTEVLARTGADPVLVVTEGQ